MTPLTKRFLEIMADARGKGKVENFLYYCIITAVQVNNFFRQSFQEK
jgi:hypothetical protein